MVLRGQLRGRAGRRRISLTCRLGSPAQAALAFSPLSPLLNTLLCARLLYLITQLYLYTQ